MTAHRLHILCAGLVALDMEFSVPAFPVMGLKHKASATRFLGGGGALLAATAVQILGGRASLRGAMGDDALANLLAERIRDSGIPLDGLHRIAGEVTPHSAVLIQPDGERTIINFRQDSLCDNLPLPDLNFPYDAALCDTRFAKLSTPVLAAARAAGKPAVLDAEAPVRNIGSGLQEATHIAFSMQGLEDFAGASDARTLREVARSLQRWVCVTRGPDPVLCDDGAEGYSVAVPHARAVNTNGAGDFWHAAFTLALAGGKTERAAVTAANCAAARHVAALPPAFP
ncbi:PfkB family carbohydrate kinase [Roseinatronobacter alkalisoli]|uniref:PfkB family carbohydrate kinase n=1 Tax=Roseinatronobacter alkalisoli TaxID=3028235 RepID=A0ABT5TC43_9RHOB|nr:PfkB family carbohydrate kinase [Roseinatronobacter sp. HJB301]MDD7972703.1 PfkB family carbohydrate kinase [Roseinatronobacter sp. HJB301]